jgi:hypothetical protein
MAKNDPAAPKGANHAARPVGDPAYPVFLMISMRSSQNKVDHLCCVYKFLRAIGKTGYARSLETSDMIRARSAAE